MAWASSPTAVSPRPPGAERVEDVGLQALVSWYSSTSTWSKRRPPAPAASGARARRPPVQEEVVVVEDVRAPACARCTRPARRGGRRPRRRHHGSMARPTTSDSRSWAFTTRLAMPAMVSALGNRRPPGRRSAAEAELGADQAEQVGGVAGSSTVNAGRGRRRPVAPEEPVGDGVERAAPHPLGPAGPTAARSISAAARRLKVSSRSARVRRRGRAGDRRGPPACGSSRCRRRPARAAGRRRGARRRLGLRRDRTRVPNLAGWVSWVVIAYGAGVVRVQGVRRADRDQADVLSLLPCLLRHRGRRRRQPRSSRCGVIRPTRCSAGIRA